MHQLQNPLPFQCPDPKQANQLPILVSNVAPPILPEANHQAAPCQVVLYEWFWYETFQTLFKLTNMTDAYRVFRPEIEE